MNIIAEVGSNWKDYHQAQRIIKKLADIGICKIKFQLFTKDQVKELPEYHKKSINEHAAKLLFDWGIYCGVDVFFTPMYPEAVDICERIGVKYYKIRYADNANWELLRKCEHTGKPIFISVSDEIDFPTKRIPLFCVPKYPAKYEDYELYREEFNEFNFKGISDHTSNLKLFKEYSQHYDYWEMHVKEDDNCLESAWSKKISDLAEVIV